MRGGLRSGRARRLLRTSVRCEYTRFPSVKVTLEDVLSLLSNVEERTSVLAVFVTPSGAVARVTGTIHVSIMDGGPPHPIVGKDDGVSD